MRALTVQPGAAGKGASIPVSVEELPDPSPGEGELLVRGLGIGICGTDREIIGGHYGWAPPGSSRLVLGHESLGRVVSAPAGSTFAEGDLVAGVVRRPDPAPCGACARGEFDMCRNGKYTERGIKELNGYGSELWTVETEYAVRVDPRLESVGNLVEPTSVVAKAWDQVDRVGARSWFEPQRALITGAGPIGLLAALLGKQRGLDIHVADLVKSGPKPDAVTSLGAEYHSDPVGDVVTKLQPDVVIEATGVGEVVFDAMAATAPYGIVCLTGVSAGGHRLTIDAGATNRSMVLENDVVIGSVNANHRHYTAAATALAAADLDWLNRLVNRRVPLERFSEALTPEPDDIKVVLTL